MEKPHLAKTTRPKMQIFRRAVRGVHAALFARPLKREPGKIYSTLELQRECKRLGLPFERGFLFKNPAKFDARRFAGSKRIIVRVEDERREFIIENADKEEFRRINEEVRNFIAGRTTQSFLVHPVGLRTEIESFGDIRLSRTEKGGYALYFGKKPYSVVRGSQDMFQAKAKHSFLMGGPHLGKEEAGLISFGLGLEKAPQLLNRLYSRMAPKQVVIVRFVKYYGENNSRFFDARIH